MADLQESKPFTADDFGPSHRWVVFVCEKMGHPMKVGYEPDEYAEQACPCGAPLVPVVVGPVES